MKKILALFVGVIAAVAMTGCQSAFTPRNTGAITGVAIYAGYDNAMQKEVIGKDLEERINKLWAKIDKMDKVEDIQTAVDELNAAFDEVIASKKLSDLEKTNLIALKNIVMNKINQIIADKFTPDSDAVEYLCGVREGVNAMIKAHKDVEEKKATPVEAAAAATTPTTEEKSVVDVKSETPVAADTTKAAN